MFAYFFLLMAIYGFAVFGVALTNIRSWGDKQYRFQRKFSHIGRLKLGIFFFSDDPVVFRVSMAVIGFGMTIMGLSIFFSLI